MDTPLAANHSGSPSRSIPWRSLLLRAVDAIGSIPFGATILTLLFVYCSVGSACPPIRQGVLADWLGIEALRFEKSEMEWFAWWPFNLLVGLLCLSIVTVTVRRIPLNRSKAGIWVTHAGVLLLIGASTVYFTRKIEGDVVIFQSRALVLTPGMSTPASMVIRPEASMRVGPPNAPYTIRVSDIVPGHVIADGPHAGERTQAIWLAVQPPGGKTAFMRRMLVGHPGETTDLRLDDLHSGAGMSDEAMRRRRGQLADPDLQIVLDYDPAEYFYRSYLPASGDVAALYARFPRQREWQQLRIRDLPRYYEHLSHPEEVWPIADEGVGRRRPIDLPARADPAVEELAGLDFRVTDYLPYAYIEARWLEGGEALNPQVGFTITRGSVSTSHELLAFDHTRKSVPLGEDLPAEFVWADSADARAALLQPPDATIVVRVGEPETVHRFRVADLLDAGLVAVGDSEYQIGLREVAAESSMSGRPVPAMAFVNVTRGDTSFTRVVLNGSLPGVGSEFDEQGTPGAVPADQVIKMTYENPIPRRLLVVAGPDSDRVDVVLSTAEGAWLHRDNVATGEPFNLTGSITMTIDWLITRARREVRPVIVPHHERASLQQVGMDRSLIRVEVREGQNTQATWLTFNSYAFEDAQRAQPRRFKYQPVPLTLADGRQIELLYSRSRERLPAPIALDRFQLDTHPGGDRPRDYISWVRFQEDGQWSGLERIRSNEPAEHAGWWYYQAQWDPGTEAHTVLGVGNRHGVEWMLAGACISIAGIIWSFYLRPGARRRSEVKGENLRSEI